MRTSPRLPIDRLEDHPDLPLILDVLSRLPEITDDQLVVLAAEWRNDEQIARHRDAALSPDSPLVTEVLAAFDAISALYADDMAGTAEFLVLPHETVLKALKSVRDALAAAYAKPILTKAGYLALSRPWHKAMGPALEGAVEGPDLGPASSTVRSVLTATAALAGRCHDPEAMHTFEVLSALALTGESEREDARAEAWAAAVTTQRRRTWALLRRSVAEQLTRGCADCRRPSSPDRDIDRVVALAADGACALLVLDVAPDGAVGVLTQPLSALVPQQRGPVD